MRRRSALLIAAAWLAATVAVATPAAAEPTPGPPPEVHQERSVFNCGGEDSVGRHPGKHYAVGAVHSGQRRNVGGRCLAGEGPTPERRNVGA